MDHDKLEEIACMCVEAGIAEIKDTSALTVVEIADEDLSDAEIDTVRKYCSEYADALQEALGKVNVR